MKKLNSIFAVAMLLFFTTTVTAQTKGVWEEKKEFHIVMSQTFHPMEEGNYKPIRERSSEMLAKAIAWQNAVVPSEYKKNKGIKKTLSKLVEKSEQLDNKIKSNCSDADIKADLTELHNLFHDIVGLCTTE